MIANLNVKLTLCITFLLTMLIGINSYSQELPNELSVKIIQPQKKIKIKKTNTYFSQYNIGSKHILLFENLSKDPSDNFLTSVSLKKHDKTELKEILSLEEEVDNLHFSNKIVQFSIEDLSLKGLDLLNIDEGKYLLTVTIYYKDVDYKFFYEYIQNPNFVYTTISVKEKKASRSYKIHRPKTKYDKTKSIKHTDEITIESENKEEIRITIKIVNRWDEQQIKKEIIKYSNKFTFSIKKLIEKNDLRRNDISHGDYIVIEFVNGDETGKIVLEYERLFSPQVGKLYSPILVRVQGDPSEFSFKDIAPSLGFGIYQVNFREKDFQYIKANLLVSAFLKSASDTINNVPAKYALHIGGYFDFGGYISIGALYQFDDKKTYLTLGIRIEELYRMFK
ncbi:MAG: hypothetical protein K8R63_11070 [Bacteroidales bacterium]|nr:hypothetical protein [Bacteroidales bacterium]